MRKTLVASVAAAAALMSGCASGNATDTAPTESPSAPTSTTPAPPKRTAPAKSFDIADQCSIVSAEEAASLGADQPPRPSESNGVPGCFFDQTRGSTVFVAADKTKTMQEFAKTKSSGKPTEVAGYPAVSVINEGIGEVLVVDISDHGSLMINMIAPYENPNSAGLATKFAEAALKNLPNA